VEEIPSMLKNERLDPKKKQLATSVASNV